MMTPENLIRHELIGLKVRVFHSGNQSQVGMEGEVSDETRNTLVIKTATKNKTVIKNQVTLVFTLSSGEEVKVNGKLLVGRPEDRVKKRLKKW